MRPTRSRPEMGACLLGPLRSLISFMRLSPSSVELCWLRRACRAALAFPVVLGRQVYENACALALDAVDPERAAVQPRQRNCDGQAEPCAFIAPAQTRFHLPERSLGDFEFLRRHAHPRVRDGERDKAVGPRLRLDGHTPLAGGELDRVRKNVD